ncbi:MAG UNVERIFIED_CONTAM: YceI family protein [Rickettsiaceae bacterium]|jgi:polyisoprenoid-binding protein YceI
MAFQIDNVHSEIQFSVRHMMVSKVRGVFEKWSGTILLDPANPSATSVDISIESASINTKDAQRDGHPALPRSFCIRAVPHHHLQKHPDRGHRRQPSTAARRPDHPGGEQTGRVGCRVSGQRQEPLGTISYGFNGSTKINRDEWG